MSFYDNTIQNKIWEKQIGTNVEVGFDFSGREIHFSDYDNHSSNYGWSLIDFGDDEYLVVNILSKQEFPKNVEKQQNKEFIINGNIFSVSKNEENGWDINLIEYRNSDTSTFNLDISEENANESELVHNEFKENENIEQGDEETNMNDLEVKKILQSQRKEIELLEEELRHEKEKTQLIQIESNEKILKELRREIQETKEMNNSNTLNLARLSRDKTFENTSNFDSSYLIDDLTKKMNEQTIQLESLKLNEKLNKMKLEDLERSKHFPSEAYLRQWELQYGNASFGLDFAGEIVSKEKFNFEGEGGWNVDYYNKELSSAFYISSTKTIEARQGKLSFDIKNDSYVIDNDGKQWKINKVEKEKEAGTLPNTFIKIAKNIQPNEYKEFNGAYTTYSSLLINLEHFPLQHLNKFDEFLKNTLEKLPYFKKIFIYSNERVYENNDSNITAYARIFFKSKSIKDDIEILLLALSMRKAMKKFVINFKVSSRNDLLSFSIFLYNHGRTLKFIHAQTNFELLRLSPIPLRLPQEALVVDREYNSILKFHENNLWKKLRPYAIDNNNVSYYICEIDLDDIDSPLIKEEYNAKY